MRTDYLILSRKWFWSSLLAVCLVASSTCAADLVESVQKIEKSVARLDSDVSTGSGVIVDDRGWIATNFHVVKGATQIVVTLRSGTLLKAEGYLAIDPKHDLAMIKTAAFDKPSAIKLAGDLPKVGEQVAAFGNPRGFSFTTSEGIVSGIRSGNDLLETMGREEINAMGYALDATWIQTTAPISPGNSGGPLVTMGGELVALNTWNYKQGQNLNFGISITNIKQLLDSIPAEQQPRHFAEMPNTRRKIVEAAPTRPGRPAELSIELPTGRVFSYAIFKPDTSGMAQIFTDKAIDQVVLRHSNGSIYAAAGQQKGLLHGVTFGQYENRQPMVFVNYFKGQRHGILTTWNESGEPALFGQYVNGKPVGFIAWHEDGDLRLLLQYSSKQLEWCQVISGGTPVDGFKTREDAEKNEAAKASLAKLDAFDESIKKNELKLRKTARQLDEQQRRTVASQLGPEKRKMASARAAARDAQDAAAMSNWFRKTLGK